MISIRIQRKFLYWMLISLYILLEILTLRYIYMVRGELNHPVLSLDYEQGKYCIQIINSKSNS